MNNEQAVFLAQWQEDCDRISALAKSNHEMAERVTSRGVDGAYAAIEKAADKLVRKDRTLSRHAAVARVLQTPRGRELYSEYENEFALRQHMETVAEQHMRRRVNKAADDREALLDAYARTSDEQAALEAEARKARRVEKAGEDAFAPIREAARRLMRGDPTLTEAEAETLAVEQQPELYDDYQQATLNTTSVASPGGLFGDDDHVRSGGRLFS